MEFSSRQMCGQYQYCHIQAEGPLTNYPDSVWSLTKIKKGGEESEILLMGLVEGWRKSRSELTHQSA